ncbi:hypothetical protein IY145_19655 [Methylosinus sp. H3A]|uniref:hypothetical protein n=1 Tax=Methylosinus sp. H3A TaxID=2785786 RepID=UPI0018C2CB2E|nr:hypothetical protein [Methylosinus sp. H3A]MBG0811569.1 hypothetical protein [Methylosinus sp. H3A]
MASTVAALRQSGDFRLGPAARRISALTVTAPPVSNGTMASSRAHIGRLHGAHAALAAAWLLLQAIVGVAQASAPFAQSGWALSLGADQLCDIGSGDRAPAKRDHSHAQCILCRVCSRDAPPIALFSEPKPEPAPLRGALYVPFQSRRPPPPIGRRSLFSSRAPPPSSIGRSTTSL